MNPKSFDYGVAIRTSRLFNEKTGRCVVIAMDHGVALGAVNGLENLGQRLEQVIAGSPEGVLLNAGAMRTFGHLFAKRNAPLVILAVDFPLFASYPGGNKTDGQVPTNSIEEAARLGADMIKICLIFGQQDIDRQLKNMSFVASTIEQCHRLGLPVMVEPTTWGLRFEGQALKDGKLLADIARIAYEMGADIVKSDFPSPAEDIDKIITACPVPIVLLGGGKTDSHEEMLRDLLVCVQNGVSGVAFGRNVWQHSQPDKMVKAIQKIVHEEDFDAALQLLK
jgi:DhnA family fructose-bisphosphate aldolase class Ia